MIIRVQVSEKFLVGLEGFMPECMQAGTEAVYLYLVAYHAKMDWRGPNWIPGPDSGQFALNVVNGWQRPVVSGDHAYIENTFGLLNWKITGGVITPKKAKFLTIPLVSGAKGVPARAYSGKLFKAGNALCQRIGKNIEAIYALSQSVTQAPWPGAMPPDEDLSEAFEGAIDSVLEQALRRAA